MNNSIGILEGWIHQRELPISWELSQKEKRVSCFLEWLSSLTDCESLVVMNENHEIIADWNGQDGLKSFLKEPITGWQEKVEQDDVILHGGWLPTSQGNVALGMISSIQIDKEFLTTVSEMLATVID